jgi:acyl carrier protein
MASTLEKVRKIILKQLDVEEGIIALDASFIEDLGADSIDSVELIMAFETVFHLEIPDEVAVKLITVGDVIDYIDYSK